MSNRYSCTRSSEGAREAIRAVFIRHGQSTANIGLPVRDISLIELTDFGWQQAKELAATWTERPDLIVLSPFLRTQQTAAATIERFPDVPVETWPIEEFCYLQPHRWTELPDQFMPDVVEYWRGCDPEFCDGDGAESFQTLLDRAASALGRLQAMPDDTLVYLFSHGHFIQAVCSVLTEPHLDARGKMQKFWREGEPPVVGNTDQIWTEWTGSQWRITAHVVSDRAEVRA